MKVTTGYMGLCWACVPSKLKGLLHIGVVGRLTATAKLLPCCSSCAAAGMKHSVAAFAKGPVVELGPRLLGSTSTEVAKVIVAVLHALTYLPLVLLPVMQDAHLKLVIVLNTSLCLCLLAGNAVFYSMSIVKVSSQT